MLENLSVWMLNTLSRVILPIGGTLIAVLVGLRLITLVAKATEQRLRSIYANEYDRLARLMTLKRASVTTARAALITIAVLVTLGTLGVDLAPILTAAGIVGLALSLGTQTIVKDFLGGITILLEDQYRVGDVITVNGITGTVEKITLRRTNFRELDGRLHIVSNGDVRFVGNDTRDYAFAVVEINLALNADVDKAVDVLKAAMTGVTEDASVKEHVLAEPEIAGWNQVNDFAVTVRLRAKVNPGEQWQVARVLRRHAMDALRGAGVPIASRTRLQWQTDEGEGVSAA